MNTLIHIKNINELVFYAGISCLIAFATRFYPIFFLPVLLLRICLLFYCIYLAFSIKYRNQIAGIIAIAMLIGWIGGYWDLIELYLRFNSAEFVKNLMLMSVLPIILFTLYLKSNHNQT